MNDEDKILETLVSDAFNSAPTFSEEMMEKVRAELLKASREADNFYKTEARD